MKKITITIATFAILACAKVKKEKEYRYTISVPDASGMLEYYMHTDHIVTTEFGCIEFICQEDTTQTIRLCNNYTIETHR